MRKDIEPTGTPRNPSRSGKIDAGLRVDSHETAIRTGTTSNENPAALDGNRVHAELRHIGEILGDITHGAISTTQKP